MPTTAANFRKRLKAIRGVVERYKKLLPLGTHPFSAGLEKKSAQLDKLAAEVAKLLGRKLPAKEKIAFNPSLDRLNKLMRELGEVEIGSWKVKSALTIEQWAELPQDELERVARMAPEKGAMDEDLRTLLVTSWACEAGKMRFKEAAAVNPIALVRQIAERVVKEARLASPDVPVKFWNKAREFNPQRLLSLRPGRLILCGLPDACEAKLEFANLNEALALREKKKARGRVVWPKHPTLPVPWRCMYRTHEQTLHEESLGTSLLDALMAVAREKIEVDNFFAERTANPEILKLMEGILPGEQIEAMAENGKVRASADELTLEEAVGMVLDEDEERVNFLDSDDETPQCEWYFFAPDSPGLPVVSKKALAGEANALALKAREIWFQRFRELLEPALPPARRATLFLLEKRQPRSPFRTFAVKLKGRPRKMKLPTCPECTEPCDVAVNLNFTHHDLPFRLPGSTLLLQTCSEHNGVADWWHYRWLSHEAKPELQALLKSAKVVLAGPGGEGGGI